MTSDSNDSTREALRLRIPEPARGESHADKVRFISAAGEMAKPALDEKVERIALMRKQLVRVLDDDGNAVGAWVPELSADEKRRRAARHDARAQLRRSHAARASPGQDSFYMQCTRRGGDRLRTTAARCEPGDMHFPTYRQQGLLIAAGYPLVDMMNQVLSNVHDPLKGRQLPVMYSSKAHGFFSISGNLATQYVQAVGWAMASALRGGTEIASAWIGEGATAESDFHAALVFASTYQAPVILNIVNNHWAISTPEDFARGASATFADRGYGFSIPALRVDGNDYLAVYAVSQWAAERARANLGPDVDRVGHAAVGCALHLRRPVGVPPAGRSRTLPARRSDRPAATTPHRHRGVGRRPPAVAAATRSTREVETAFAEADSHGSVKGGEHVGSPTTMFDDVFAELPRHLREQRDQVEG